MIHVFTTGGTIDKVYFDALSDFHVGPTTLADILAENNVYAPHQVTQLMRKDSLELDDADRAAIHAAALSCDCEKILITHGTDTMAETGKLLGDIAGKTVVLTGSLQPARIKNSDAAFNVGFAFAAVQTLPPGAYIAMNGQIFDPATTRKDREAGRFTSTD
jgi:L-asparaginase